MTSSNAWFQLYTYRIIYLYIYNSIYIYKYKRGRKRLCFLHLEKIVFKTRPRHFHSYTLYNTCLWWPHTMTRRSLGSNCIQIQHRWLSPLPPKFHFQNKTNNKVKQNICYALLFKNLLKFKLHIQFGRCCGYAIFPQHLMSQWIKTPFQQAASSCGKFGGISSMTTANNLR